MRYFLHSLALTLRQQFRSWRVWLMLLLLPALVFAVYRYLPAEEVSAPVQVGVCLPNDGGEAFWDCLSARSGAVITFLPASENTIRAKVSTGQWDCGLVLDEDFASRLEELDTDGLISVYIGSGSAVYPIVEEAVSCTLMELISPLMADAYIRQAGISGALNIQSLAESQRVTVHLQTLTGGPLQVTQLAKQTTLKVLQGCVALFLLIWAMFLAMDLGSWMESDAARRMRAVRSDPELLLSRGVALLLPPLLSALCALAILGSAAQALVPLLGYLFTLGAMALLLSRFRSVRDALPCLMPFIAVLALLLSPVVFDVSVLFPALAPVCNYLPMGLYLNACGGSLSALGILWLEGGVLLALFFPVCRFTSS